MKETLFEIMNSIDDEFLEKSEKKSIAWKKYTALAASFCLICIAAYTISSIPHPQTLPYYGEDLPNTNVSNDPDSQIEGPEFPSDPTITEPEPSIPEPRPTPEPTPPPAPDPNPDGTVPRPNDTIQREDPPTEFPEHTILRPGDEGYIYPEPVPTEVPELPEFLFEAIYNDSDDVISAAMPYIPGYFRETLDRNKLQYLQLSFAPDWMDISGLAGFDQDGRMIDIRLSTPTQISDTEINISISKTVAACDYVFPVDAEVSFVGDVEVKMYRWVRSEDSIYLQADGVFDGVNISISVKTDTKNEATARKNLETVVYLYAHYFNNESLDNIGAGD